MSNLRGLPGEPITAAGDDLLTDIINDPEAPSYHVIERVRRGILEIEAQMQLAGNAVITEMHGIVGCDPSCEQLYHYFFHDLTPEEWAAARTKLRPL